MDRLKSKSMPSVGSGVAAAIRVVPSKKARHYRDHDYVPTRLRTLEYDDSDLEPSIGRHKRTISHHKRHNSQDGYHLVVHGSDESSRRPSTSTAPLFGSDETLQHARKSKVPELQELPVNRKRNADSEETRQHSFKKLRKTKDDRSDRLCLQCGNYHSSPCYVPLCNACDLNHYHNIPCSDAKEKLKERLGLCAIPKTSMSPKQKNKKKTALKSLPLRLQDASRLPPALSGLHAPSAPAFFTSEQKKESPGKRPCPICRECGSFHRSPCKWLVCETCKLKHHPETSCAAAEARLKRRLEEEDARQAQMAEEIKQRAQNIIETNEKRAATGFEFRRSSAPSPGRAFSPEVAPKKIKKLKKNTRFCRDCGRYLNGPCTWPTCRKCGTKHFDNVPCWKARQTLQDRLDTFDRGYGTSQQKKPKVDTSSDTTQSPFKHAEELIGSNSVASAAPVDVAAPINMTFNVDANGQMTWSLDFNKTVHYGPPPSFPNFTVSTSSMPPQNHSHVHPSRQALRLEPSERSNPATQGLSDIPSSGSGPPLYNSCNEVPQAVTCGVSVEQSVDAFFVDVAQAMHGSRRVTVGQGSGSQSTLSYLEYLRRNSST